MTFKPIGAYGVIGNLETCPLVSDDGSIDWCCFPHLESSSVFARILDTEKGGRFSIQPAAAFESDHRYLPRTNVLETTFRTESGAATLTDFMPVTGEGIANGLPEQAIYRRVECTDGSVGMDIAFEPQFDYARAATEVTRVSEPDPGIVAHGNGETFFLSTPARFRSADDETRGTLSVKAGDVCWFVLQYEGQSQIPESECESLLERTCEYWRDWTHSCSNSSSCRFAGPWHDHVVRSELVLKLLTHRSTNAVAAAPTTSLPEDIGGVRNWDYRFNWIRDAVFTIEALQHLGHADEARNYFEWCLNHCSSMADDTDEQPFYRPLFGLEGERETTERTLDHLSGYRNSSPVRIGNDAWQQRQHDIYGELLLAVYETARDEDTLLEENWPALVEIVDYVCSAWNEPDEGIWEVRGESRRFTYSAVMCWAAVDRGIKLADKRGLEAPLDEWTTEREAIREAILEHGYNYEIDSFVQSLDGDDVLDAAALRIPVVGFLPFDDERVQGTIEAVHDRLLTKEGLVHRYDGDDGLPGEDSPFVLCSFWLVDALALSGRVEEARALFERVLEYASPLGLFAEEIDAETGEQRGNFPQAFSHIGLLNSARHLTRAQNAVNKNQDSINDV